MRLWHLLVRQVYKSDNPENPGSDNSARTKHPINAKYACGICAYIVGGKPIHPDLLLVSKTPSTSIYGTKLTSMVNAPNQIVSLIVKSTII